MTPSSTECPICSQQIPGDPIQLQQHVNHHLDAREEQASHCAAAELSRSINQSTPSQSSHAHLTPAERMIRELEENDAALASAMAAADTSDLPQYAQSLLGSLSDSAEQFYPNILSTALPQRNFRYALFRQKVHTASETDLFSSNIAGMGWDCGFRNIQMMCSALLNGSSYRNLLATVDMSEVPSIPEIAARIEQAWQKGFDPEGASRFGGKLVDKEVWIGATEVYVLLRSLNIPAFVKDFETPNNVFRQQMFEWIFDHFENWCKGEMCPFHRKGFRNSRKPLFVPPLFCQWPGHSLTIVGAEKARSGRVALLILDPVRGFYQSLVENRFSRSTLLRRDVDHPQFQQPRFQLVSIPNPMTHAVDYPRNERRGLLGRFR